ncbi:hypothetical protein N9L47_09140 [Rhodobacteraceae bacterium]|nr:hypothetical protein [Paracoccaceae bacterium]
MIIRVYDFDRGNESLEMIKTVRDFGAIRLSIAKRLVEKFLKGDIDHVEFECEDANGPDVLAKIEALGFIAKEVREQS